VFHEHAATNIEGAHVVVVSSAVRPDNPEIVEAEARKIPVIARAEMLAELARLKYSICVAGTHGKTTTTSMIATVLDRDGRDPTIVVGGRLNTIGSNARLGKGDTIVLEADESDRSFLMLSPTIAVVTNIEPDHLDCYKDLDDIQSSFLSFVNKVPFYGAAVLCLDEPAVQSGESGFDIQGAFQRRQHPAAAPASAGLAQHAQRDCGVCRRARYWRGTGCDCRGAGKLRGRGTAFSG
jgi:UDP-N-acetylmuramate--alanine ligase